MSKKESEVTLTDGIILGLFMWGMGSLMEWAFFPPSDDLVIEGTALFAATWYYLTSKFGAPPSD